MINLSKGIRIITLSFTLICASASFILTAQQVDKYGSPTAESILNNSWTWPPYANSIDFTSDTAGFAAERLTTAPAYGVHPRILFGPADISDIRSRLRITKTGQALLLNLHKRTQCLYIPHNWEYDLLHHLHDGDLKSAKTILDAKYKPNGLVGHYQPYFIYEIVLDAFDAVIHNHDERAAFLAQAFYHYTRLAKPKVESAYEQTLYPDNIWLSGIKEAMDYQFIAYGYDFLFNHMNREQQNYVRDLIAFSTYGKITVGMEIPPHFRHWNWVMVGNSLVLSALAIEGEKGYDDRVYTKSVEVLTDYLTYGISKKGVATEAVGYTGFGFYWGAPAMLAMARRGDNLYTHPHYKAMKDWYLYTLVPYGNRWNSHGDGGVSGPTLTQMQMMKYFYPDDAQVDFLWKNSLQENQKNKLELKQNLLVSMISATDGNTESSDTFYRQLATENKDLTFIDSARGTLVVRNEWSEEAASLQVEARKDGVVISHEHADRGSFSFASHGRMWSPDGFRSIESKYHNTVLVDGKGQSALPAKWIAYKDTKEATFASFDLSHAYHYSWVRDLFVDWKTSDPRLADGTYYGKKFRSEVIEFKADSTNANLQRDTLPHVVEFFKDFDEGNPKIWGGESGWPYRKTNTPVRHAYRTIGMVKGPHPYVLIADDIQKDESENLYEWLMMLEPDLSTYTIEGNDILLCNQKKIDYIKQGFNIKTKAIEDGTPMLLIRVIDMNLPEDYNSNPSIRMEIIEKFDTYEGKRGRSFGVDKRLVIPSRSVHPDFKILLFPHRSGDDLPLTNWNKKTGILEIQVADDIDTFTFSSEHEVPILHYEKNGISIF